MKLTRRQPSANDRIFINYRRDDSAGYAGRLADSLGAWFGPERVFRVRITRRVANFGVAVISTARGVTVEPRTVRAGDEDRQVGSTSLPVNLNAYLADYGERRLVSGAVMPESGLYDVVFDSPSRRRAGAFAFRFWVNDVTPPRVTLETQAVAVGRPELVARATDAGSGVDPQSIVARVDGRTGVPAT